MGAVLTGAAVPPRPAARKMTLAPLIAVTYFLVAGGPFGLEDIVYKAGYAGAILILSDHAAAVEPAHRADGGGLAGALPRDGGYYVWVTRAMGRFWGFQEAWLSLTGSLFDMAIYPTLFVAYLGHFAPALTAHGRGVGSGSPWWPSAPCGTCWDRGASGLGSVALGVVLLGPFVILTL